MLYPPKTAKWLTKYVGPLRLAFACTAIAIAIGAYTEQSQAHDVISTNLTYSREVSRIFARRCVTCHSSVDSIPLTKYEEVRPWAVGIKDQVLTRAMPPWGAVKGFGNLAADEALSQEEVMTIAEWVIGGAPEGSKLLLPQPLSRTPARSDNWDGGKTISVKSRVAIAHDILLAALRPDPAGGRVESSQIVAKLPDGEILPLVWLYQYETKWDRTFRLRTPIALPKGTVVEASTPVAFRLEFTKNFSR